VTGRCQAPARPALSTTSTTAWPGRCYAFFEARGLGLREIGLLASIYPAIWGAGQLGTGWISDYVGRKSLVVAGMMLQSLAIAGFVILPGLTCGL